MVAQRTFTPEMIENGRYRYEETDEPVASIAADYGVTERTFRKWVKRHGWRRRIDRPPVGLPRDLELSFKADRALQAAGIAEGEPVSRAQRGTECCAADPGPSQRQTVERSRLSGAASHAAPRPGDAPTDSDHPPSAGPPDGATTSGEQSESHRLREAAAGGEEPESHSRLQVAEELEREAAEQLADVKRLRTQIGPLAPADAERTARTLERLTDTLTKVRRLRAAAAGAEMVDDYDDIPRDIDEFRERLTRRIEIFVRDRMGGNIPPRGGASDPASS